MISRLFCQDQIGRLARLKGYPRLSGERSNATEVSACLRDMIDSLVGALSEDEAKTVIDIFIREPRDCPFPAEISSALRARRPQVDLRTKWGPVGWLCPECDSWGYVQGDQQVQRCGACESGRAFPQVLLGMMNDPNHGKSVRGFKTPSVAVAVILSGKRSGSDKLRLRDSRHRV